MTNFSEALRIMSTIDEDADEVTLRKLLKIPTEKVYKFSPDGKTYLEPWLLRGTPVERISESSEH